MHNLHREQTLDTTLEEAWAFISNPQNLNEITPDDMGFEILDDVPQEMFDGLLITYRITLPIFGKQKWVTEIKHIRPHLSFVDEQRLGPYQFWYHYHEISEVEGGVKFTDRVTYRLPFGLLGKLVHRLVVGPQLRRIFAYRKEALEKIFPPRNPAG